MTEHAQDWVDVLQALLTPTIALAAVGIGLAQWWIARNKLKLDLFDRRWGVYIAARDLLSEIFTHGKSSDEAERRLLQGIRGVRWLFDERVEAYLTNELWAKATLLRVANSALERLNGDEAHERAVQQHDQIVRWAASQDVAVDALFDKFLKMDRPLLPRRRRTVAAPSN